MQLTALDTALEISDMDLPGYNLHRLRGDRLGTWSVSVDKNWRLTFNFFEGSAMNIDYEDYH